MFDNTILLDDASGDEVTYNLVFNPGNDGTKRLDAATTLAEPGYFTVKHTVSGTGPGAVDRHLVSITRTLMSAGSPRTLTVNLTIAVPRDVVITNQIVFDAVSNLIDFVSGGSFSSSGIGATTNILALLRGEG